jgi:hypothetical protein
MNKREKDSLTDEFRQSVVVQDELAKSLGFWLLRNKREVYRAITALRYMRTSPITEEEQRAAEQQIDRLSHEWNRTDSHYRGVVKRTEELRARVRAAG